MPDSALFLTEKNWRGEVDNMSASAGYSFFAPNRSPKGVSGGHRACGPRTHEEKNHNAATPTAHWRASEAKRHGLTSDL
eukprot:576279-Pyramimonas_sp.AAC.1